MSRPHSCKWYGNTNTAHREKETEKESCVAPNYGCSLSPKLLSRPVMTFAVDWALKINDLSIYISIYLSIPGENMPNCPCIAIRQESHNYHLILVILIEKKVVSYNLIILM